MLAVEKSGGFNGGGFGPGLKEPADGKFGAAKQAYVKPRLATHGSVQQMTEGAHKSDHHGSRDSGSNISFRPDPIGGKIFSDW